MINSTDLKNGVTFLHHSAPYKVIKYSLIKMGRGGATVKLLARNLETGASEPISLSSNVRVDEVNTQKRRLQYLYSDKVTATFMDPMSFDQVEIPVKVVESELPYVKEGGEVNILFWDEKPMSIDIPPKVTLEVKDTDPGVKGNSATNVYKPAILENGLEAKVPLFINRGDKVVIDTRDGNYVERAK
jgi:elongation factor P